MIKLEELFELQNDLDKYIVEKSMMKIEHNDMYFLKDRITALFTEVAEFANATRCFKYWSKKPAESKDRLIDEYVDIFHFWLSIGNTMKFTAKEVEAAYYKKYAENIDRQNRGDY